MIENVGDCIWKVIGTEPGSTIVVFGGVHGNELTGIEVVRKMHKMFVGEGQAPPAQLYCGTLYLILGNPKAIARDTRGSEDHADLNRCFTRDVLEQNDATYERTRAKELAQILVHADVSIDLHATNKPSVPFLCCKVDEAHEKIYQWFDCDRVLTDPDYILAGEPVTTDDFVDLSGGVGICYETGQSKDLSRIDEVLGDVMNMLHDQGMLAHVPLMLSLRPGGGNEPGTPTLSKGRGAQGEGRFIYELVSVINLTEAGFRYEGNLGGGSFEEFTIGQTIGYVGNEPIVAEFDGVIVFPKIPELQTLSKPVVYLAKKIK